MRRGVATAVVACVALAATSAAAATRTEETPGAGRLIFLLEYVGSDYENAVRDGAVTNRLEYGEVLGFARDLVRGYAALPARSEAVLGELRDLEQLVVQRAPGELVREKTRGLLPILTESVGGGPLPPAPPSLADGRRLWLADCAICHGSTGSGDGRAAAGMEPPPTAFRGRYLERLSPRQVYNALSYGIEGTAMPSFEAYSDEQRWAVAFYVMTLRVGFEPERLDTPVESTVDELAVRSNEELLAELRRERGDATPENVDYLRANFTSPRGRAPLAGAGSGDPPHALAAALQVQEAFAAVAARVAPRVVGVSGYERDPGWTPERLQSERGDAWMSANEDELRYPGFRRVRSASGFSIDDEGHVLSVDHLLRDERGEILPLIDVELSNHVHVPAAVVGAEPALDLAVLRIADRAALSELGEPLELGDLERLEVGHWVVALGDPHGPEKVFVVGVVSSPPARQCYQEHLSATLLQSSLAVPAGGLGGPVVDLFGRVAGISVRPRVLAAGFDTVPATGTLPIGLALRLFEALKVASSVRSPWIGVSVLELPLLRRQLEQQGKPVRLPEAGVYVDAVFASSPAARAGVRPGDFLLGLGGHPIGSVGDFQRWLYVLGIGATVDLDLLRDGAPLRVRVAIEVRPESATSR